jgi:hypothetical protein
MNKVEESILSKKFSNDTCIHLIEAISNVAGEANTVLLFYETITKLYDNVKNNNLNGALLRALLRMTMKAPIILDLSLQFIKSI